MTSRPRYCRERKTGEQAKQRHRALGKELRIRKQRAEPQQHRLRRRQQRRRRQSEGRKREPERHDERKRRRAGRHIDQPCARCRHVEPAMMGKAGSAQLTSLPRSFSNATSSSKPIMPITTMAA